MSRIVKIEPMGYPNRLNGRCERKRVNNKKRQAEDEAEWRRKK